MIHTNLKNYGSIYELSFWMSFHKITVNHWITPKKNFNCIDNDNAWQLLTSFISKLHNRFIMCKTNNKKLMSQNINTVFLTFLNQQMKYESWYSSRESTWWLQYVKIYTHKYSTSQHHMVILFQKFWEQA